MGFNLGDVLAGAAGGFGQGMAMNAKSDIDAQQQETRDRRSAELETQRATAMANLQRTLTQPDRDQAQKNFDTTATENARYHDGVLADKSVQRTLTDQRNTAMAEAAAAKAAGMGGAGGTGAKPGKLDQTLTDADKNFDSSFYKRVEEIQKGMGKPEEIAAQTAQLEKARFSRFGMKTEIDEGGGVTIMDRTGYTKRFNSPKEAADAGFKTKTIMDAMAPKEQAGPPANLANSQPAAPAKTGGFNLADVVTGGYTPPADSPAGQRAARVQAAEASKQAEKQGQAVGAESARAMVRQNYQSYSPEDAQRILDAYGSLLSPPELTLLQQRIRMAR